MSRDRTGPTGGTVSAAERAEAAETFGREVLGPIVAEFCLRLWSLGTLMERPAEVALLFCARGGLRMQLAYEHFLANAPPTTCHRAPLMVSRVVAIRPALMRTVKDNLDTLLPGAAATLSYEFPAASLAQVALAMAGVAPSRVSSRWDAPFSAPGFATLLRHPDGGPVVDVLSHQARLFTQHLHDGLSGRRRAVLVDTGLYGSTRQVLADGLPNIGFGSALIARSFRRGPRPRSSKTFGLSVEADGYSPLRRRTAMLRYWHFVEWFFEPDLPSVRTFVEESGTVRSSLEVPGWQQRIEPRPGTGFAGVIDYLDALGPGSAARIVSDSDQAWNEFRRAVVWPDPAAADAMQVGLRSHDFGSDETWSTRPWRGPVATLQGSSMWREGEIGGSGSLLRRPLLAAVETAHSARFLKRALTPRR